MKHRKTSSIFITAGLIATSFALGMSEALAAKNGNTTQRFTEYANVVNVQPVYRQVTLREPTQQCWTEQEQHLVGYEQTTRYREQRVNRSSTGGGLRWFVLRAPCERRLRRFQRQRQSDHHAVCV